MQLVVEIPDALASRLGDSPAAMSAAAVQALAIDAYRRGQLTTFELREWLALPTRAALDGVLKEHGVPLDYSLEDFDAEGAALDRLRSGRAAPDAGVV